MARAPGVRASRASAGLEFGQHHAVADPQRRRGPQIGDRHLAERELVSRRAVVGTECADLEPTGGAAGGGHGDRLAGGDQTVAVDFLVPTNQVEELLAETGSEAEVTAVPLAGSPGSAGAGS